MTDTVLDVSTRASIKLGQHVREKVTGFAGIVSALQYEMDGTIFVGIQSRELVNGVPAEVYDFDIERIEVVDDTQAILNTAGEAATKSVRLGAIYRDSVTGMVGTAIRKVDFLGGCTRLVLRPKVDKDGKLQDTLLVPVEQAEIVDDRPAEVAAKKATKTGGPGTSDQRMMARALG